jgi:diadenosine tetraphosphate (Ap4A) HIT family hydrolase
MADTIFDKIVRKEIPCFKVWEDDNYLAFLTPFPNTPGLTLVIPKVNPGDNAFHLNDQDYLNLMAAAKKVASKIERALEVKRVAMVIEGTGVPYVHVKLYPLYGEKAEHFNIDTSNTEFTEEYKGWITTMEGPKMDDSRLIEIQQKIMGEAK